MNSLRAEAAERPDRRQQERQKKGRLGEGYDRTRNEIGDGCNQAHTPECPCNEWSGDGAHDQRSEQLP